MITKTDSTENERLRALIRELIAQDNDIELTIDDADIERAAAKVFAPLAARIAALEAAAAKAAPVKPTATAAATGATATTGARLTVTPKAERLDVLRAAAAKAKASK